MHFTPTPDGVWVTLSFWLSLFKADMKKKGNIYLLVRKKRKKQLGKLSKKSCAG